jgi:hypothetical protein
MPTAALAPTKAAGSTSDIAVTSPNKTVALYQALNDAIQLEESIDQLLLESGDLLLLESQAGDAFGDITKHFPIFLKDPLGGYNRTHLQLTSAEPFISLPAGTWQVQKPATDEAVGIQYD